MTDLIKRTIDILTVDADRWRAIANGIDRELLDRPPAPREWSALECLRHASLTEAGVFSSRVRAILEGRPDFEIYDPDSDPAQGRDDTDPQTLVDRHAAGRVESLSLLATITDADLDRTSRHPAHGVVSLRQLLNEWAAHDLMHIVQAERAVMQPFIIGSGPWRPSFADHDVEAKPAKAG